MSNLGRKVRGITAKCTSFSTSTASADSALHCLQVFPKVNPNVVKNLDQVDAIIYGMGSLYTSICPSLVRPCKTLFPLLNEDKQIIPVLLSGGVGPTK